MNETMWNPRRYTEPGHDYVERQFHRAVRDRETYRAWSWFWFSVAVIGWTVLAAVAFKTGIIGV